MACVKFGLRFVGVELHREYFDVACERIENAYRQGRIFDDQPARMQQQELIA